MRELESKIKELKTKIVSKSEWNDSLPELLKEDDKTKDWNCFFDGDIFVIDDKAEMAYIELHSKVWQVCFEWIPLWRINEWKNCMSDWLKDGNKFFAIPYDDDEDNDERKGRKELEKIGFRTDNFEGF